MGNKLSQSDIDRVIEMAWEDRTTFADIRKQFGIQDAVAEGSKPTVSSIDLPTTRTKYQF